MDFVALVGIFGGILGVTLYLPQIIRGFQTKSTRDVALWTYLLIFINDVLWSSYGLGINNMVIAIPNIVSVFLCIVILLQKRRYG